MKTKTIVMIALIALVAVFVALKVKALRDVVGFDKPATTA